MDVLVLIENATFSEMDFSIAYDSSLVQSVGSGMVFGMMEGLSLTGVTNENLEGSWKKATFSFSGNMSIGAIQYESDAVLQLRLTPIAEGTVPISLWTSTSPRYPASYKTCSLVLRNGGVEVPYERKEWNDGTQLITFTDKTSAAVLYQYDLNLGTPISNGFFRVTYSDGHVEEFHASNPARGITIDTSYGGYFITPQADAVSYSLLFPEYEDIMSMGVSGRWSISHTQPDGYLDVKEVNDGFHGIQATPEDISLTISATDIGLDFDDSQYDAAIIGDLAGVLNKTTDFERISDDTVRLIIRGGLAADYYNLYVYKDGLILGRAWFNMTAL
jgi:hypothetical protein